MQSDERKMPARSPLPDSSVEGFYTSINCNVISNMQ